MENIQHVWEQIWENKIPHTQEKEHWNPLEQARINQIISEINTYKWKILELIQVYQDITWEEYNKDISSHIKITQNNCNKCLELTEQNKKLSEKYHKKISEYEGKVKKLESKVYIDELTQAFNRRKFDEIYYLKISKMLTSPNKSFSVAMIDLDNFKSINDEFWHSQWDIVLREVREIIQKQLKWKHSALFRYWWEEFAILSTHSKEDLSKLLESILETLRTTPIKINQWDEEIEIYVTYSAGVSQYNKSMNSLDPDTLKNKADSNLYMAKNSWRNKVYGAWYLTQVT